MRGAEVPLKKHNTQGPPKHGRRVRVEREQRSDRVPGGADPEPGVTQGSHRAVVPRGYVVTEIDNISSKFMTIWERWRCTDVQRGAPDLAPVAEGRRGAGRAVRRRRGRRCRAAAGRVRRPDLERVGRAVGETGQEHRLVRRPPGRTPNRGVGHRSAGSVAVLVGERGGNYPTCIPGTTPCQPHPAVTDQCPEISRRTGHGHGLGPGRRGEHQGGERHQSDGQAAQRTRTPSVRASSSAPHPTAEVSGRHRCFPVHRVVVLSRHATEREPAEGTRSPPRHASAVKPTALRRRATAPRE